MLVNADEHNCNDNAYCACAVIRKRVLPLMMLRISISKMVVQTRINFTIKQNFFENEYDMTLNIGLE